jgi:hypothetical protein
MLRDEELVKPMCVNYVVYVNVFARSQGIASAAHHGASPSSRNGTKKKLIPPMPAPQVGLGNRNERAMNSVNAIIV